MFADSNMQADDVADEGGDDDVELALENSQPITPSTAASTCAGKFIFNFYIYIVSII